VQDDAVLAAALGPVQGHIGGLNQALGGCGGRAGHGHAQADGDRAGAGGEGQQRHDFAQALGRLAGRLSLGFGQDDGKFLAAVAGDGIHNADALAEEQRQAAQQFIAGQMPARIVELLEVVNINQDQPQRAVASWPWFTFSRPLRTSVLGNSLH